MIPLRASGRDLSPTLDLYLREIRDDSLLSAAEERTLADAIARGDKDAKAKLIQSNLRLVVRVARDYVGRGLPLDDLIGEGNLGLIRAAEEYNPGFGTRFSTYASYWIKQAIRAALTNTTATIRLPAHMVGLLTKWRRAERDLRRELGQAPTFDQIAVALGLTDAQRVLVERALTASRLRRDGGASQDEDGSWSADELADGRDEPDAALEAADERRDLLRRLDRLDPRERTIVALRYGLEGQPPLTLKEVGRRLGVTREWVRKIEIRAVAKLDGPADPVAAPSPRRPRAKAATPSRRPSRARALQSA
ncbi:MAG TPA: RNA polymerase sigma factor RpoD/SigA [Isosphaeraceae bacterium]|jgi:RNA polymerase primary sigma factor|nr:RNA polymerase sigma factor RpoD/SigA [Isosphaeraceae bacterium]